MYKCAHLTFLFERDTYAAKKNAFESDRIEHKIIFQMKKERKKNGMKNINMCNQKHSAI